MESSPNGKGTLIKCGNPHLMLRTSIKCENPYQMVRCVCQVMHERGKPIAPSDNHRLSYCGQTQPDKIDEFL